MTVFFIYKQLIVLVQNSRNYNHQKKNALQSKVDN